MAKSFSGPLPSPDILEKYERIVPGSAQSLFDDFHKNSQHIRELEVTAVRGTIKKDARAQWMAYSLAVVMTGASMTCAAFFGPAMGIAMAVSSMPVTIGAFLRRGQGER